MMIPMLPNQQGVTSFWQMHEQGNRVLVDTMMSSIEFQRIVHSQEEVDKLLEEHDPSMIKFIESSLQETCSTSKINSVNMPINTQIITFRSESASLLQDEIQ